MLPLIDFSQIKAPCKTHSTQHTHTSNPCKSLHNINRILTQNRRRLEKSSKFQRITTTLDKFDHQNSLVIVLDNPYLSLYGTSSTVHVSYGDTDVACNIYFGEIWSEDFLGLEGGDEDVQERLGR